MAAWLSIVIPLVVVLSGAFVTYKATTRAASGRVNTTVAETLWEELNNMKDEYRRQAKDAESDNVKLRGQVAEIQTVCASLRERVVEVERSAADAKLATEECQEREEVLMARIKVLETGG